MTDFTNASFSEEHFEKEICTITRLGGSAARESLFLPSIDGRSASEWKDRFEYHREKIVRAKPQSRIIELDTPREDISVDERNRTTRRSNLERRR